MAFYAPLVGAILLHRDGHHEYRTNRSSANECGPLISKLEIADSHLGGHICPHLDSWSEYNQYDF